MNVRVDHLSLTQVVAGGLILGGVLGLLGTALETWARHIDDAIAAADLGPRGNA